MSRSDWNWANDRFSRWWACSLVYVRIRFAAMLYVGRNAERRWNDVLAASSATSSNRTHGDHSTTALPRSSIPRRPARPVSWVYSPGVRRWWCSPVNFVSFSITTVRAGMLMPTARVSVAKTTLTRPLMKHSSTTSFIGGTIPA